MKTLRHCIQVCCLLMVVFMITTYYYTDTNYTANNTQSKSENIAGQSVNVKTSPAQSKSENIARQSVNVKTSPAQSKSENIAGKSEDVNTSLTRKTKLPPLDKHWAKILHFIPEEENQNCMNLFTTESSRFITVDPQWERTRAAVNMSRLEKFLFAPQHEKLTFTYQELARLEFVHTVCEIGFNIGQSAITWLTAKPDLKLYSFDIGSELPEKMGRALEKLYPDRFQLIIGKSNSTVPRWLEQGVKCDIVSIDGGHHYPDVHADILNMQRAAAKEHIIVLDDIYYPGVNRAWKEALNKDVVHHLFDCWIQGRDIDFALGYYKHVT